MSLRCRLQQVARQYGAELEFVNLGTDTAGETVQNRIKLCTQLEGQDLISAFYHELGHAHFYSRGIHKDYHEPEEFEASDKYCNWRKALTVEREVDDWAEQEARKHGYGGVYKFYHQEPQHKLRALLQTFQPKCCGRRK